jgi:predicted nucleic acid-binding protein
MTPLVIDVSVLIAAVSTEEPRHEESHRFLKEIHKRKHPLREPAHFLLELYAVLNRRGRELKQLGFMTETDPLSIAFHGIGEPEVQRMLEWLMKNCPGRTPTRGADLAYLIVALETNGRLVTLDKGLMEYRSCGANVYYPNEMVMLWSST